MAVFFCFVLLLLVAAGVYINLAKKNSIDHSKLPQKVELSRGFQKWITNLKNKDFEIEADDFRLLEENEIYNTKWIKINSLDEPGVMDTMENTIAAHRNMDNVVFSPSNRIFLDYRNIVRDGYNQNEARLYGQKEDKLLDARILDCSVRANCFFDRAYFLDNDVFVISEISRTIDKKDTVTPLCTEQQECEYSFKVHVMDLINNKRLVYESVPFQAVLAKIKPEL
jgi:hypothetical protein